MSTKLFIVVLSACIFLQGNYATAAEHSYSGDLLRKMGDLKYKTADTLDSLFSPFHPNDDSDEPRHTLIGDIFRALGDAKYRAAEKADGVVETAKSYAGKAIGKIINKVNKPFAKSSSNKTTPKTTPKIVVIDDGKTQVLTREKIIEIARRLNEAKRAREQNE